LKRSLSQNFIIEKFNPIFNESSIDCLLTMEAEPKLIFGYLSLISDTKSNQFLLFDQLISIFFNPNFTNIPNSSKNKFLIRSI
jgi:hypothetical protein